MRPDLAGREQMPPWSAAHSSAVYRRLKGVPTPPLEEQHEIVRRIETAFAWIDRLAFQAISARKLIDHLDQAVLAKAFRGELVPQDPWRRTGQRSLGPHPR
jgi:hypothetical protein